MTLTTYPATTDPSDLSSLNLTRLINRLEYNLLSSNADLKSLRRSEYQRMRVNANIEYARASLQALERSLPQIKPVDRRHELQSTLSRNRQALRQIQNVLDEIQSEEEVRSSSMGGQWEDIDAEDDEDEDAEFSEDLLETPEGSTSDEALPESNVPGAQAHTKVVSDTTTTTAPAATTVTFEPTSSPTPTASASSPAALRNRHRNAPAQPTTSDATATGSSLHTNAPSDPKSKPKSAAEEEEEALSHDRLEQENITSSLLDLASQLKASSQTFQASLEAEKSVLARAAEGLDRTTGNLASAENRMGMLRRMTEGKGWWGRMLLYAWIFALWVVAILIVFVGPKLRF
ncbi:hypothetical protein BDV18DRAFT_138049 [Aspergillus unguis]